ncbi:hypothetical protein BJX64DRAFT_266815 [Aspergillus heterothallicus]
MSARAWWSCGLDLHESSWRVTSGVRPCAAAVEIWVAWNFLSFCMAMLVILIRTWPPAECGERSDRFSGGRARGFLLFSTVCNHRVLVLPSVIRDACSLKLISWSRKVFRTSTPGARVAA